MTKKLLLDILASLDTKGAILEDLEAREFLQAVTAEEITLCIIKLQHLGLIMCIAGKYFATTEGKRTLRDNGYYKN